MKRVLSKQFLKQLVLFLIQAQVVGKLFEFVFSFDCYGIRRKEGLYIEHLIQASFLKMRFTPIKIPV